MSNEEENYILQKELDKVHAERRQRQLDALRDEERAKIAFALNTSEEVAAEALALGFDAETAAVLPLVPLIRVAWADGKMTEAESAKVFEIALKRNVTSAGAVEFLDLLMAQPPSDVFFERTERVIRHIVSQNPNNLAMEGVLDMAKAVAQASGGFFGLKNPVSDDEQKLIDELAALLGL